MRKTIFWSVVATALALGCKVETNTTPPPEPEAEGPFEEAGEEIDEEVQDGDDAEDAADEVEDAADEVEEEVDDDRSAVLAEVDGDVHDVEAAIEARRVSREAGRGALYRCDLPERERCACREPDPCSDQYERFLSAFVEATSEDGGAL